MEAYIDNMVVKSKLSSEHLDNLGRTFDVLLEYKLRLNVEKCAFGVSSGKFLGYIVSRRGIEADPKQLTAVQNLRAPTTIKEVQRLTGMVAALNHFIHRSRDLCQPFFQAMKTCRQRFIWKEKCEQSLQTLKVYLSRAPLLVTPIGDEDLYLYLAVSNHATSTVLVRKEGIVHQPIYYSSKTMTVSQTRYLPMDKLALALVSSKTSLLPYFQTHQIVVLTEYPLKAILRKMDSSSRILKFSQDLANYDIQFEPRT